MTSDLIRASTSDQIMVLPTGIAGSIAQCLSALRVDDLAFMLHREVRFCGSIQIAARPSLTRHTLLTAALAKSLHPRDNQALSLALFSCLPKAFQTCTFQTPPLDHAIVEHLLMERFEVPSHHRPNQLRSAYPDLLDTADVAHMIAHHPGTEQNLSHRFPPAVIKTGKKAVGDVGKLIEIPENTLLSITSTALTEHIISIGGLL